MSPTTANYLGLQLNSPIIVGSCSLTRNPETVRELAIAGAGAVVLPSLFEEQVVHQMMLEGAYVSEREEALDAVCYVPSEDEFNGGTKAYLQLISSLKNTTAIPLIASINGCSEGKWLGIATEIEKAGADALEVMLEHTTADASLDANQVEERLLGCIATLCDRVDIPISVKLTQFHTSLANLSARLQAVGASGLVCFAQESDWHIELEQARPSLKWSLTPAGFVNPTVAGLTQLRNCNASLSIAASGGISSPEDLIKVLMAGADVGMVTSEIYRSGPDAVAHMLEGLNAYLGRHHLATVKELLEKRPRFDASVRKLEIDRLTHEGDFLDPTPRAAGRTGDRWGHKR